MRLNLCFTLLVLYSGAFAQLETGEPLSNGVLSFIEDMPQLGSTDEGIRRAAPFVEVIDADALETCKAEGLDSPNCPPFEYSIPFLPKVNATDVEAAIVDEWLRFETRSYYRTLLETGTLSGLIHCTTGLGVIDLMWYFYRGDLFFPAGEFCDDFPTQILPTCFFACDIPLAFCPGAPGGCLPCVLQGIARAEERKYTTYYLEYTEEVALTLAEKMPTALLWQGPTFVQGGSLLAPITGVDFPTELIDLANDALQDDPRAVAYFLQSGAYATPCQPAMPRTILEVLRRLPGDSNDPNLPGLPELEGLKRQLANRESAGGTYTRFPYFWNGEEHIYPRYAREGPPITASTDPSDYGYDPDAAPYTPEEPVTGPDGEPLELPALPGGVSSSVVGQGEEATQSVAPPLIHACFGYATFFHVYQELDTLIELYRPIQRLAKCYAPPFGIGVSPVPPVPIPWEFAGYRFHTDWTAVPEGYDIPYVKGTPIYFDVGAQGGP